MIASFASILTENGAPKSATDGSIKWMTREIPFVISLGEIVRCWDGSVAPVTKIVRRQAEDEEIVKIAVTGHNPGELFITKDHKILVGDKDTGELTVKSVAELTEHDFLLSPTDYDWRVKSEHFVHTDEYRDKHNIKDDRIFIRGNFLWRKVEKLTADRFSGELCDLEVEGDYVADSVCIEGLK